MSTGCLLDESDEHDATLDDFGTMVISLNRDRPAPTLMVELASKIEPSEGTCPVLRDVTATFGGVPMTVLSRGGYDDFSYACEAALFRLDDVPAIAGARIELDTPDSDLFCPFDDVHLDAGLSLVEGDTWTQAMGTPRIGVRFARPGVPLAQISAQAHPAAGGPGWNLAPMIENDTIMLRLSTLPAGDYTLRVEQLVNLNSRTGRCLLTTGAFATAPLMIQAP